MIPDEIIAFLESRFQIHASRALAGGDINQVYRIDSSGGVFCLKINSAGKFPEMFIKEAKGLSLLQAAKELRVPSVVEVITLTHYSAILLEFINTAEPVKDFMFRFGASLAKLHDHTASFYGLDHDNYMGSLPQSNRKSSNWIDFFREERLEKQLRLARDSGQLTGDTNVLFSRLFSRLDQLLSVDRPSLLHGDLWGGNFMVSETGEPCLIDPAVYYGHREVDLAMTKLFGGFSSDFYHGYESHHGLVPGWRERLDLYNLYPLLVHVTLFGGGYIGSVRRILQKFS
ncbi:MAG: fructosamine kinase family protein [Bacteroidales bacterium]|nr:fructosamine kinase family protein [Bacteroidales bacterium]